MSDPHEETSPPPTPSRSKPAGSGPFRWLVLYTRGLILNQHLRRMTMFYVVIAAMVMAFAGDVFLSGWLRERLMRFAVYWMTCGWLTILAALLAIYDLLLLRVQHRLLRRQLRERMLGRDFEDGEPKE